MLDNGERKATENAPAQCSSSSRCGVASKTETRLLEPGQEFSTLLPPQFKPDSANPKHKPWCLASAGYAVQRIDLTRTRASASASRDILEPFLDAGNPTRPTFPRPPLSPGSPAQDTVACCTAHDIHPLDPPKLLSVISLCLSHSGLTTRVAWRSGAGCGRARLTHCTPLAGTRWLCDIIGPSFSPIARRSRRGYSVPSKA